MNPNPYGSLEERLAWTHAFLGVRCPMPRATPEEAADRPGGRLSAERYLENCHATDGAMAELIAYGVPFTRDEDVRAGEADTWVRLIGRRDGLGQISCGKYLRALRLAEELGVVVDAEHLRTAPADEWAPLLERLSRMKFERDRARLRRQQEDAKRAAIVAQLGAPASASAAPASAGSGPPDRDLVRLLCDLNFDLPDDATAAEVAHWSGEITRRSRAKVLTDDQLELAASMTASVLGIDIAEAKRMCRLGYLHRIRRDVATLKGNTP